MAKKLLIVESPAKIKTISKFLGKDFHIMSTFGHVKDLPPKKLGIEIKKNKDGISVDLEYAPIKDKAKTIADICKAARMVEEIYLATDPDREGEIISWHIEKEIEKVIPKTSKMYRITFNEITKPAITRAIEDKSTVDIKKVEAQQARRVLDRWVGYEVSPILWRKLKKGLSAGRVQSAALLLVCNRQEEIDNFKPEESWSIHGTFTNNATSIIAELVRINNKSFKLKNKKDADKTVTDLKKETYKVTDIKFKKRSKKPLPPFMTSTLQQDSYNKLGFSVDRTMMHAQKLYEGLPLSNPDEPEALITYMRTDSLRLSDTAIKSGRGFIEENFGNKYLPKTANLYAKKAAQDAHEAIRPINVDITPEIAHRYLNKDQAKLYELIWKRFVASQMTPAEYAQKQVSIEGGIYIFRVTGTTLVFDGFLKVYLVEDEDEKKVVKIPKEIEVNTPLDLKKLEPKQHFTQPPPSYTEASLVKEMEKQGIGRPSTYAATLSTVQKRNYIEKEKKKFVPTLLGKAVNKMLQENLPDIINLKFTAEMEDDLDKIEKGDIKRDVVLGIFYKNFEKDLKEFAGKDIKKQAIETNLKCPKCKSPLVIRFGKSGDFVGCSKYPECKFTSNFSKKEDGTIELQMQTETKLSDIKCPKCGRNLIQKFGKFGPFLSCPGYPECKYIHQESLKMPCPKCGGKLVKRKWKGGSFWGCSSYPKCRFAIFSEVIEEKCPKCDSKYLLVIKDKEGNVKHACPNKECDHTKKIESE
jgi:DNA topoisomerase I